MRTESLKIHIKKQSLKFSSAHMTVFRDGKKEALHGHNYQVELHVTVNSAAFKQMISFADFKRVMKKICEKWDEKVLLAAKNPFFQIKSKSAKSISFDLCQKKYLLPLEEIELLPIDNIICETLAQEFCRLLLKGLGASLLTNVISLEVRIDESPGQGATYQWLNLISAEKEIQAI